MKTTFEANGWIKFGEEDIYEDGCQPNTSFSNSGNDRFTGNTIQELIDKCQEFAGSTSQDSLMMDSCEEIGRLDIGVMENKNGYPASEAELKDWEKAKTKLYYCVYTFNIQIVTREDVSLTKPFVTT